MSAEPTGFLYPFIEAEERDAASLLTDLASSARAKIADSQDVRTHALDDCRSVLDAAGAAMAHRFRHGGRVLAFGNGGSATDADACVDLFRSPAAGRPLAAVSLVDDRAVLTALANDVGFDLVFSRQVIAHARAVDIAIGFSTSGGSANVLAALDEAHRRGLLTIGLAGYDGGAMATVGTIDHCFVVRSDSVHRIQEAQASLVLALWSAVQRDLAREVRR